jgi:glutamine cyclotransferase
MPGAHGIMAAVPRLAALLAALAALVGAGVPAQAAPVVRAEPLLVRPHDPAAFTQGLVWSRGRVFESSGLYGASWVRQVRLRTGRPLRQASLPAAYFAEGLAMAGGRLVQLTYREGTAFVWDGRDLSPRGRLAYAGEGWGLATLPGGRLVMSDGSDRLRVRDPATLRVLRELRVTDGGRPVANLNELEVIRGEVWANVWLTDRIAVIDLRTGRVRVWLDCSGLRRRLPRGVPVDVLNGIAWDRARDRVLVTGKYWPRLYELRSRVRTPA